MLAKEDLRKHSSILLDARKGTLATFVNNALMDFNVKELMVVENVLIREPILFKLLG